MAIRVIMVLSPAVAIATAVLFDKAILSSKKMYPKIAPFVAGILILLVLVQFVPPALEISRSAGPSMNSEWHDMLTWIKENTPEETTTISWWDPGHWVTAITQRHSGADGAHLHDGPRPIGYRLEDFGYMFTTTDEAESIERMRYYLGDAEELYLISSVDLLSKFTWLSYFSTGDNANVYRILYLGGTQPQGNELLYVYPMAENLMLVISDNNGVLTPWLYQGTARQQIKEMALYQNNQLQRVDYGEGLDGMVWVQPDFGVAILMLPPQPGGNGFQLKNNILTQTYLFNAQGLEKFELVYTTPGIRLYRIHFD